MLSTTIKKSTAIVASGILGISLALGALAGSIQLAHAEEANDATTQTIRERVLQRSCDYSYETSTLDGIGYSVEETVSFGKDGNATNTVLTLTFPDSESAQQYLEGLQKDYENRLNLIDQDENELICQIDVSNLEFDKEEYEDALRYSVEDLTAATDDYDSKTGSTKLETLLLSTVSYLKTA